MHAIGWNLMTLPKAYGGVAMCNLKHMNSACLMKLGWSLRNNGNNLWCQVLGGKYARQDLSKNALVVKPQDFPHLESCSWDLA